MSFFQRILGLLRASLVMILFCVGNAQAAALPTGKVVVTDPRQINWAVDGGILMVPPCADSYETIRDGLLKARNENDIPAVQTALGKLANVITHGPVNQEAIGIMASAFRYGNGVRKDDKMASFLMNFVNQSHLLDMQEKGLLFGARTREMATQTDESPAQTDKSLTQQSYAQCARANILLKKSKSKLEKSRYVSGAVDAAVAQIDNLLAESEDGKRQAKKKVKQSQWALAQAQPTYAHNELPSVELGDVLKRSRDLLKKTGTAIRSSSFYARQSRNVLKGILAAPVRSIEIVPEPAAVQTVLHTPMPGSADESVEDAAPAVDVSNKMWLDLLIVAIKNDDPDSARALFGELTERSNKDKGLAATFIRRLKKNNCEFQFNLMQIKDALDVIRDESQPEEERLNGLNCLVDVVVNSAVDHQVRFDLAIFYMEGRGKGSLGCISSHREINLEHAEAILKPALQSDNSEHCGLAAFMLAQVAHKRKDKRNFNTYLDKAAACGYEEAIKFVGRRDAIDQIDRGVEAFNKREFRKALPLLQAAYDSQWLDAQNKDALESTLNTCKIHVQVMKDSLRDKKKKPADSSVGQVVVVRAPDSPVTLAIRDANLLFRNKQYRAALPQLRALLSLKDFPEEHTAKIEANIKACAAEVLKEVKTVARLLAIPMVQNDDAKWPDLVQRCAEGFKSLEGLDCVGEGADAAVYKTQFDEFVRQKEAHLLARLEEPEIAGFEKDRTVLRLIELAINIGDAQKAYDLHMRRLENVSDAKYMFEMVDSNAANQAIKESCDLVQRLMDLMHKSGIDDFEDKCTALLNYGTNAAQMAGVHVTLDPQTNELLFNGCSFPDGCGIESVEDSGGGGSAGPE